MQDPIPLEARMGSIDAAWRAGITPAIHAQNVSTSATPINMSGSYAFVS
jgi:hypothetical protein